MNIKHITAREIIDSRGNPTVEADVVLEDGTKGRAAVPSGASTGSYEAHELRDKDPKRFLGKGVLQAVENVNGEIAKVLVGQDVRNQENIDQMMIELDGTKNKSRLGANAILAVSLASAEAVARLNNVSLWKYVAELSEVKRKPTLPLPLCNIINGGKHADNSTSIQEFMILPIGAPSFREAVRMMAEVFHALKQVLTERNYQTTVGDEGGYAPSVKNGNEEALDLIALAVQKSGYQLGKDIVLGLDVASSELFSPEGYAMNPSGPALNSEELISWYDNLSNKYPIASIEDGLAENDWDGWKKMTEKIGNKIQLVGDDLLVTNVEFLERAIQEKAGNAILIKVNQIGTLTETIAAVDMAHRAGWKAIISHRSGETENVSIAHLAVGLGAGQIKTGSMSRADRTAKYNELLRIEEELGTEALFAGSTALSK